MSSFLRSRMTWSIAALMLLVLLSVSPSPSTSVAAFVYELVRRCPEGERPSAMEFYVIGHRGAAAHAIENTIPSMDTALTLGANALELDLCLTRDDAIVLWHDWMPDDPVAQARQRGAETDVLCRPLVPESGNQYRRPVHELTLLQVREHFGYAMKDSSRRLVAHIPTLDEFLAWAAGKPGLRAVYLDIKIPREHVGLAPRMISLIEMRLGAARPPYEVVYIVGADTVYDVVERLVGTGNVAFDNEPPAGLVLDPCEYGSVGYARARGNRHASTIIPITSTFAPWTTARRIVQCDLARAGGSVRVVTGTMNDSAKLACLVGLGVHGIYTDHPERLRAIAEEQ